MTPCRSCGSAGMRQFLSLGRMPLADAFLHGDQLDEAEDRYPLDVAFCEECSLVQILQTVPPEILFCRDFPYYSSFSDALLEHSRRHVEGLVASRRLGEDSLVVELASNDGCLLQYFARHGIPVLGIDPAEGPAKAAMDKGIPTLNAFFDRGLAEELRGQGKAASVIIANNVLAHVADTHGFVEGIRILLADDGVAVIEVPYVRDLIRNCEFDTIYHEHLCYFSVTALEGLFGGHGLTLQHLEHLPIHGGSLRIFAGGGGEPSESVRRCLKDEAEEGLDRLEFYEGFGSRVEALKSELQALVGSIKADGRRIAAYGAAAKGTILLNYIGLGREQLDYVVDRNVHKQGRYVPGVRLPIHDPARILEDLPDYVLILPWNLKDEILRQQGAYRKKGGKFILPIPRPEIV